MTDIKFSDLPSASAVASADKCVGLQSGAAVDITAQQLATYTQTLSGLTAASALGGTELLLGNQSSNIRKITPAQINTYVGTNVTIAESQVTNLVTDLAGKSPLAGSTSIVTTGTVTTGTWNGTAVDVAHGGTGLGTLTTGNVILGAGTSTPTFVAPSTSGNVLTSNGSTWVSSAAAGGSAGSLPPVVASGNFVTPFNMSGISAQFFWLANYITYIPIYLANGVVVKNINIQVTTLEAAQNLQLALYNASATTGKPTTKFDSSGNISIATTGVKQYVLASNYTVSGLFYVAMNNSSNTATGKINCMTMSIVFQSLVGSSTNTLSQNTIYTETSTFNTWPPTATPVLASVSTQIPCIWVGL